MAGCNSHNVTADVKALNAATFAAVHTLSRQHHHDDALDALLQELDGPHKHVEALHSVQRRPLQ